MGREMLYYESAAGQLFAALASGKNYMSLHLMPLYYNPVLAAKYKPKLAGIKMGKACLNFTKPDEIPYAVMEHLLLDAVKSGKRIEKQIAAKNKKNRS